MSLVCTKCVREKHLTSLIEEYGEHLSLCPICGAADIKALSSEDARLRSLFRALVRYYYSEWDYNTHLGGENLEHLLRRVNPLTAVNAGWDEEAYEEAVFHFVGDGYEPYDTGISLFSGYNDFGRNPPLVALKEARSRSLYELQEKLQKQNYFLLEDEAKVLLEPHAPILNSYLDAAARLLRARIGYETKATPLSGWGDEWHYKPYEDGSLGAPPPYMAGNGRLNRQGVSFLYLATNEDTAISEVRPHPGHYVSVGAFENLRHLKIADFNSISIRDYCESDKKLRQFVFLKNIDILFSMPIPPEERHRYSFPQFLSDVLRQMGFDGVAYRSSVGTGINFTIFDPSAFKYVADSSTVHEIEGLTYKHSISQKFGDPEDYVTDTNGNFLGG